MLKDVRSNNSEFMVNTELLDRLNEFIEHESRSCSMDIGGITPLYVYRMWGGSVPIEEITEGLKILKAEQRLPK